MSIIASVIGGVGLFLLAVSLMTDGLKQAAGNSLRSLLAIWTSSAKRGVLSGFLMTAIVQSSSAVTVATIGFVNAGLLTVRQALGVVYGSNIGTTITGWLVVLVGFKLNIHSFALPMIGIGMALRLAKKEGQLPSFGLALVGFGLFFVGIDVLKSAFEAFSEFLDMSQFTAEGIGSIFIFLILGTIMTIITQSSSASVALTITAVTTGVVGIYAAAAMVIGANVGTTTTALIASIGATPNAKRVALAQVIFNVATGVVALLLLPVMFFLINGFSKAFDLSAEPSVSIALFHTTFNLLGVLMILPFNHRLAGFLETRFIGSKANISHLKYLDKTLTATPVLAVSALILELKEMGEKVLRTASNCIVEKRSDVAHIYEQNELIKLISHEVSQFIVHIERNSISQETASQLTLLLRVDQYFLGCANNAKTIVEHVKVLEDSGVLQLVEVKGYNKFINDMLHQDFTGPVEPKLQETQAQHDAVKAKLLAEGVEGNISFTCLARALEFIGEQLRMAQRWLKAKKTLKKLEEDTGTINKILDKPTKESEEEVVK